MCKKNFKVPHIGFNEIKKKSNSIIFKNINNFSSFYFNHSFGIKKIKDNSITSSVFNGENIICSFEKNNIFGVQFHPEKSQNNGLKLLNNFLKI